MLNDKASEKTEKVKLGKPATGKKATMTQGDKAALRAGESEITDAHWKAIVAACGGEKKLIAKLGVDDKRKP